MVLLIVSSIIFLFLINFFEIFKRFLLLKIISFFLAVFIFYFLLYHVTYNSDWDMYEAYFDGHSQSNDFLFNYITKYFSDRGYEYASVYKFHILLMGAGFIFFQSRFSYSNIFVVISTYLLFQLVPLSNQIRYYVAFSFFLIAVYNLIVYKSKALFIIFAILSLISHLAILLFYPFIYLYYNTKSEKYIRKLILYSFILVGISYFIFSIGVVFSFHFGAYFSKGFLSSILGGIFNNFIWIFWFLFIYNINKRIVKDNSSLVESDTKYQFLYKLSLYSLIFFPISIILQVFAHRYIAASLIVWLAFIFYSLHYEESLKKRLKSILLFIILVLGTFIYIYILPTYLLGISATDIVLKLFLSNKLIFLLI